MAKMLTIEIGNSNTKAVLMDYKAKKPKVYKCAEFATPQGAVADGYIVPEMMEQLRDAIKKGLKKNRLSASRVIFTIFSGKIITREIVVPGVREHQINAMVQANINEYFPIDIKDYKITSLRITTFKEGENSGKHKVVVIAAEKKLIQGYEELADELKLKIVDIDYAGNSVFQAVRNNAGVDAVMTVKIEDENALITIARQSTMAMQRYVNYSVGPQADGYQVSPQEAAQTLLSTVQRVKDFYEANDTNAKISKIFLIGEGSKSDGLVNLLQQQTRIACIPLDIIRNVSLSGSVKRKSPLNVFATAIGAGIASAGLDNDREKERQGTNYAVASFLMILLIALVAVAMTVMAVIPYNTALLEQQSLQKKQQSLEPARQVYEQYTGTMDLLAKVRYGQALTKNSNDAILDFLSELEQKLPADVEVSDFSSSDTQCVISMTVDDKETAAGVINKLREFESVSSVTVTSISENTVDDEAEDELSSASKNVTFTLTAEYYVQSLTEPTGTVSDTTTAE